MAEEGCSVEGVFQVVEWQNLDTIVKKVVVEQLVGEWKREFSEGHGVYTVQQCMRHMNDYWRPLGIIRNRFFVIINDNNQFIGCVGVDFNNNGPFIVYLFVDKKFRNTGFGTKLVNIAIDYASSQGCSLLGLWCSDALVRFYQKLGFSWSSFSNTMGGETVNVMYSHIR